MVSSNYVGRAERQGDDDPWTVVQAMQYSAMLVRHVTEKSLASHVIASIMLNKDYYNIGEIIIYIHVYIQIR